MKKAIDWGMIGRFLATIGGLYSTVRTVLTDYHIGPEFLEWIIDNTKGKAQFTAALAELAKEYRKYNLPSVVYKIGGVEVAITKKDDKLWVGNRKLVALQGDGETAIRTMLKKIKDGGYELASSELRDFLLVNLDYFPENWKETVYVDGKSYRKRLRFCEENSPDESHTMIWSPMRTRPHRPLESIWLANYKLGPADFIMVLAPPANE